MNIRNIALRQRLYAFLLEGKPPKQFALEHNVSVSWAYRLTWEMGFRSVYVTEEERQQLQRFRKL